MYSYLPLKFIREEDVAMVGVNTVNLAKLGHSDIPIAEGVVVFVPKLPISVVLNHFNYRNKEIFESSLEIFKTEVLKTPIPADLADYLKKRKLDHTVAWKQLLEMWIQQVRAQVWSAGIGKDVLEHLKAEVIIFSGKIKSMGLAYFNEEHQTQIKRDNQITSDNIVIDIQKGLLDLDQIERIKQIVKIGNRKIFIPQIFSWMVDERGAIKIVKVTPYTHKEPDATPKSHLKTEEKKVQAHKPIVKTVAKVLQVLEKTLHYQTESDGFLINGCLNDQDKDNVALQLVEAAAIDEKKLVLYKLPDIQEKESDARGVLRLIHDNELLQKNAEIFLFAKNKKGFNNLGIVVPFVRSVDEFLQIKRDLAVLGVSRKGSLKLYLEICVPENMINLEDYIASGIDGVVINLDELASWLGGYKHNSEESVFYKRQIKALTKVLDGSIRVLRKSRIDVYVTGVLAENHDLLHSFLKEGITGIVTHTNVLAKKEEIFSIEKRVIHKT